MKKVQRLSSFLTFFLLTACVTINVYFPAAAAESAADKLIQEVYGIDKQEQAPKEETTDPETGFYKEMINDPWLVSLLNSLVPMVHAQQADINISTPGINKLKSVMKQRHSKLSPFYSSGAVGMDSNGLIAVKDIKAAGLKERNTVKKLVSDENRDRSALYKEIAKANGHPEWENEIRGTFARRWIANAPGGWWYKSGGAWKQK